MTRRRQTGKKFAVVVSSNYLHQEIRKISEKGAHGGGPPRFVLETLLKEKAMPYINSQKVQEILTEFYQFIDDTFISYFISRTAPQNWRPHLERYISNYKKNS